MNEMVPVIGNGDVWVGMIDRAVNDPNYNVDKLEALLRLRKEWMEDQRRMAFLASLSAAQAEMLPVASNAKNTHLGSRYATLDAIDEACRPVYTGHGITVRYGSEEAREGHVRIVCTVAHSLGHQERHCLEAPISALGSAGGRTQMTGVQSIGAAITYLRRYLVLMALNVQTFDDDDGEAPRRPANGNGQTRRGTIGEWLAGLELALTNAKNRAQVDRILDTEEVLHMANTVLSG